ncbi:MAG: hypothetical protein QM648_03265 [Solirubrobacterales bacterium]
MTKKFLGRRPTLAQQRLLLPDSDYHVFSHAIQGLSPFATDELKAAWAETLRRRLPGAPDTRFGPEVFHDIEVYAMATMGNHPHLILGQGADRLAISRFFGNCLRAFALRYNHLTGHKGPVFVRPYDLRRLENRAALRRGIAYVHRNPKQPELIARHTSHPLYIAGASPDFVNVEAGLAAFGGRDAYAHYFDRYCAQKSAEEAR